MTRKALHIILDGCRPDALQQAHTPHIDSLWQSGAYTWTARSLMPCVTLPCHTAMFRSVSAEKHGIGGDNVYRHSAAAFPSILDVAKQAGLHAAMFYSWGELRDLARPGSLRMAYCREAVAGLDNDTPVTEAAIPYLVNEQPDLCVLYLGDVDIAGHQYGWMSPEYLAAVEANDRHVGMALDALDRAGLRDQFAVLLLADHGGHERNHGADIPEDMTIPWLLSGPGIKRNHVIQTPVDLRDTAATIAHLLGLERPAVWEGKPVCDALA